RFVPFLPRRELMRERFRIAADIVRLAILEYETARELLDRLVAERIQMTIRRVRRDVDETKPIREIVVRAVALEADRTAVFGRLEMREMRHEGRHALVLTAGFSGESPEDVP